MSSDPPSLFGSNAARALRGLPAGRAGASAATHEPRDLVDLLYDGFYMIFLLRNGAAPQSEEEFRERLRQFFSGFERGARQLGASAEDISLAKLAFTALIDEQVLTSRLSIRDAWERRPLQLEYFGEQLAGARFFVELDKLREQGAQRLQALEVFHMCLLLGFQGRYALEGSEKLGYYTARLGEEIAHHRGRRAVFAPHWQAPDRVAHKLEREVPLWAIGSVFALVALLAYLGLAALLQRQTETDLRRYSEVIKPAPRAAYVTITLP